METSKVSDVLKSTIIKHKVLIWGMNFIFKIKNKKHFFHCHKERSGCSIFDYEWLAQPIPYYPMEKVIENNYYGIGKILRDYVSSYKCLDSYIEHGVFLGSLIHPWEDEWNVSSIITCSRIRKNYIVKARPDKKVITVGPYIHYATPYYLLPELNRIKNQLGRVLLVFPSHSVKNVSVDYDIDQFIDFIESIKHNYDTVLVSLYWLDVLNKIICNKYLSKGYRIVTAGNRFDMDFLSRLKSIMQLADDTISNSVGTHVGYCIYLDKPHYIFQQDIHYKAVSKVEEERFHNVRSKEDFLITAEKEEKEIEYAFRVFTPGKISVEQIQVVDKYWGISEIKTPVILKEMLGI